MLTVYFRKTTEKRLEMSEQHEQVGKSIEAMDLDSETVASSSKSIACSRQQGLCFWDFD